jgi:predicted RNA-binding Zn-ribbon protein involved in translation (DUF1610 family)
LCCNERMLSALKLSIRRIKKQAKQAKYPLFYPMEGLLRFAFRQDAFNFKRLLLLLRITTLMRSCDLARIAWGLWESQGRYFLITVDKNASQRFLCVQGLLLKHILHYLHLHRNHPNPFFLRHAKHPWRALGAERIAKLILETMTASGVDTTFFKAHSLRGATATHLLQKGIPQTLVRNRGGWSSDAVLDSYYARLHNMVDWECMLLSPTGPPAEATVGEHAVSLAMPSTAGPTTRPSPASTTEEVDQGEGEWGDPAVLGTLSAHGLLHSIEAAPECPACGIPMRHEASYRCRSCGKPYHIRCLASRPDTPSQPRYRTECLLCSIRRTSQAASAPDVIDVMGIL